MPATKPDVLISDLSSAQPAGALSRLPMRNKWYMLPYRTAAGSGVLLRSYPEAPAPRVRIGFEARGRYAVYLGIHYAQTERDDIAVRFGQAAEFGWLHVRLSRDAAFARVLPESQGAKAEPDPVREIHLNAISEVFWRYAQFDGPDWVEIEPATAAEEPCAGNPACLAWLRLVPLDDRRRALADQLVPAAETRRITVVASDSVNPGQLDAILAACDFDRLYLDCMRIDAARFPSPVIPTWGSFEHECGNFCVHEARTLKARIEGGWDPLQAIISACGAHGVSVYPAMRIALHRSPPQHLPMALPNRLLANREHWVADRSGDRYPHPALAVPEVRKIVLEPLIDVLQRYDVAGICILGIRGWPWIGYEKASARLFEQRFGTAIHEVSEQDERFIEHRCEVFTGFVRELRQAVDEAGAARSRRLRIAFDAMNCIANCRFQGQDIVRWANEGLIDELTLNACHCPTRPEAEGNPTPALFREVREAIGDPSFSIRAHLWPRFMTPRAYLDRAAEFWDAGGDGLALWDLFHRNSRLSEWAIQRHLGHVDQYDALRVECDTYWRSVAIEEMDGICMTNLDYSADSCG